MPTVWFYQNIATNKQNTYYTKTVSTLYKYHKYTPKTQKRGKQLPFWLLPASQCVVFFVCTFPFCRTKPTNLSKRSSFLVGSNLLFCRLLYAKRPCISVVYTLLYNHYN